MTATRHRRLRRPPAWQRRRLGRQLFAQTSHAAQHRFGKLFQRVKLADLMRNVTKNLGDWLRIQGGSVCRDAANRLATNGENLLQPAEKRFAPCWSSAISLAVMSKTHPLLRNWKKHFLVFINTGLYLRILELDRMDFLCLGNIRLSIIYEIFENLEPRMAYALQLRSPSI